MKPTVIIANHTKPACGIYQFGITVSRLLAKETTKYEYLLIECENESELKALVARHNPVSIIFNYSKTIQTWVTEDTTDNLWPLPLIGFIHEITPAIAHIIQLNQPPPGPFIHWLCADPTLMGANPFLTATVRPIPPTNAVLPAAPKTPTVGTFGFGSYHKGHKRLVMLAAGAFPRSTVRYHLPHGYFGDAKGKVARDMVEEARAEAAALGGTVTIEANHEFLTPEQLQDWLAGNTVNVFLYEDHGNGVSSSLDHALAVPRPIAISRSRMYRHMFQARPSIIVDDMPLALIVENGLAPLEPFKRDWTPQRLAQDFDAAVDRAINDQAIFKRERPTSA